MLVLNHPWEGRNHMTAMFLAMSHAALPKKSMLLEIGSDRMIASHLRSSTNSYPYAFIYIYFEWRSGDELIAEKYHIIFQEIVTLLHWLLVILLLACWLLDSLSFCWHLWCLPCACMKNPDKPTKYSHRCNSIRVGLFNKLVNNGLSSSLLKLP